MDLDFNPHLRTILNILSINGTFSTSVIYCGFILLSGECIEASIEALKLSLRREAQDPSIRSYSDFNL